MQYFITLGLAFQVLSHSQRKHSAENNTVLIDTSRNYHNSFIHIVSFSSLVLILY